MIAIKEADTGKGLITFQTRHDAYEFLLDNGYVQWQEGERIEWRKGDRRLVAEECGRVAL